MSEATKPPYVPHPQQAALIPSTSGNAINGLGETERRRPTTIYWDDPDTLPHGDLMKWFIRRNYQGDRLKTRRRAEEIEATALESVAETAEDAPAGDWVAAVKGEALKLGASQVGIAPVDPLSVFDRYEVDFAWIVVLALPMDYALIATSPSTPALNEVLEKYNDIYLKSRLLANWIRRKGWRADPYGGVANADPMTVIPGAIEGGIGQLGKHGSMISPQSGACFRLAFVLTDLPLLPDAPRDFGVDEFCANCRLCQDSCPPKAIAPIKQTVRGKRKWNVDFDKCVLYFNEHDGCGICLAICPWSRPGVAPRLADKMTRRKAAVA